MAKDGPVAKVTKYLTDANIGYLPKSSVLKSAGFKIKKGAKKGGMYKIYTGKLIPRGLTTPIARKKNAKVVQRTGPGTVIEQRVYDANGRLKTVYTIDTGSMTFASDLGYAFKKNVARARRENKKKFGTADAIIQKG